VHYQILRRVLPVRAKDQQLSRKCIEIVAGKVEETLCRDPCVRRAVSQAGVGAHSPR